MDISSSGLNYYGDRMNLETMHKVQLYTLTCASFVVYLVMILCGTLGSPNQISDMTMACGPHNSCSLEETLAFQMQICQSNQDQELHTDDVNMLMEFYVPLNYNEISPDDIAVQAQLSEKTKDEIEPLKLSMNYTMAVYDSNDPALLHYCQVKWADIITNHDMLSQTYTAIHYEKNLVIDLDCDDKVQYGDLNQTYAKCSPVEPIARLQDQNTYRMIKIALHRETEDDTINVINKQVYTGLKMRARNPHLEKYECIMQMFFLLVSGINLALFIAQIKQIPREEIGQVQILTVICLAFVMLYNLPYKLFVHSHTIHMYIDSAITSVMFTLVLMLNLVLLHGMAAPKTMKMERFYIPKVIPCLIVSIALFYYQISDDKVLMNEFKYTADAQQLRQQARVNEQFTFKCLVITMSIYGIACFHYLYQAATTYPSLNNEKRRFTVSSGCTLALVSICTVTLLLLPVNSNTLQFMNENGLLNIYLLMFAFLVSSSTQEDMESFNQTSPAHLFHSERFDNSIELSDLSTDEIDMQQRQAICLESGEEDHTNPEAVIRRNSQKQSITSPIGNQAQRRTNLSSPANSALNTEQIPTDESN